MTAYPTSRNTPASSGLSWRRGALGCGVALLVGVGLCVIGWLALDLRLTLRPATVQQQAAARWAAAGVAQYTMDVRVVLPLRDDTVYALRVADGEVIEAARINPGLYQFDADPPREAVEPSLMGGYTVTGLLATAARISTDFRPLHIATPNTSQIIYDSVYGYPVRIVHNTCGILFGGVESCIAHYEVLAFRPLP